MTVETLQMDNVIFVVSGFFDAQSVLSLEEDFNSLLNDTRGDLVLDLKTVDFMDSSGIGSIVFLYKRLAEQGRSLSLTGVAGQPARLLKSLRVDQTIKTEFVT